MTSLLTELAQQKSAAELQTLSRQSIEWLKDRVAEIRNPARIPPTIRAERNRYVTRFLLGGMYFFFYNPKTRDELPYYDRFPLVLMLQRESDGFLGLNLHYLPVRYRVMFLQKLVKYGAIYNENDEIKRVRITYEILSNAKRFREFRPCLKRYLYSNIKSRILAVQPNEWDVATMLPVQQFKKAQASKIWRDSIQEIKDYNG